MLRKFGNYVVNRYLLSGDGAAFAARKTRFEKARGRMMTVHWDDSQSLFRVTDATGTVHVARKERVRLQNMGVAARRTRLIREYLGGANLVRPGDVVIDCGANIGEFSVACAQAGGRVYAFEPDPQEFSALSANAIGDMTFVNKALWHTTETLTFYDNNASGDSSLIDTGHAEAVLQVQAVRLDDYAREVGLETVRLIKLEAEGAEPEVLDGAGDLLDRVDYIAVDMGPERGMSQENTVVAVFDRLIHRGFRLVHFDNMRFCGLFAAADAAKPEVP
jgi:FkbM family methyltransferase